MRSWGGNCRMTLRLQSLCSMPKWHWRNLVGRMFTIWSSAGKWNQYWVLSSSGLQYLLPVCHPTFSFLVHSVNYFQCLETSISNCSCFCSPFQSSSQPAMQADISLPRCTLCTVPINQFSQGESLTSLVDSGCIQHELLFFLRIGMKKKH